MGSLPGTIFESFRVGVTQQTVPAWKVRLVMALASLVGVVVVLLLLPLILFALLLIVAWVAVVRLRLWMSGLGRPVVPDDDGRENVRVLARDA